MLRRNRTVQCKNDVVDNTIHRWLAGDKSCIFLRIPPLEVVMQVAITNMAEGDNTDTWKSLSQAGICHREKFRNA